MAANAVNARTEIEESLRQFNLEGPLSAQELEMLGQPLGRKAPTPREPRLLDPDEDRFAQASTDAVAEVLETDDYNRQYAHYLRCQSLVALAAFEEGWQSLEEMVLKEYVRQRRRENLDYRGDDPNKAFALRLRQQAAEDFVNFVRIMLVEARATPKPSVRK